MAPRLVAVVLLLLALTACTAPSPAAPGPTAPSPAAPGPTAPSPAAPGPTAPSPAPPPVPDPPTVVIDPGHNGGNAAAPQIVSRAVPDGRGGTKACNTTGAQTDDGLAEHAVVWDVAGRLAAALRASGVRVVLTRDSDNGVGPCVDERGRAGERAGADAVISVHADGAAPDARGFHVLFSNPPLHPAQGAPARALADAVVTSMRAADFLPATYIGRDGLDARDDIAGLNHATVPSVLVELGNLRHPGDAATAASPDGRERHARAIADAVTTWLAAR